MGATPDTQLRDSIISRVRAVLRVSGEARRRAIESARSFLFVPGNRPERFAKAAAAGADVVILDLEDAVAPSAKADARRAVVEWSRTHERSVVRINGLSTEWASPELDALRGAGVPIMLPKTETVEDVRRVVDLTDGAPVLGLVETPRGVLAASGLAASAVVTRLALGNVDLAALLGVDPASQVALAAARGALVLASAAAGLPAPIDGVTTQLDDLLRLEADVRYARELGFGGRLCIHPRQVGPTNDAMSPSAAELAWAERVLAAGQVGGVAVADGAMLDAPVVARARRVLARAASLSMTEPAVSPLPGSAGEWGS